MCIHLKKKKAEPNGALFLEKYKTRIKNMQCPSPYQTNS